MKLNIISVFDRDNILMISVLIVGELHCPETDTSQNIAVKVLKDGVSNEAREDFEREVEIMSAFDHDNILKLLGIVTDSKYNFRNKSLLYMCDLEN